jgi:hypothetical protein
VASALRARLRPSLLSVAQRGAQAFNARSVANTIMVEMKNGNATGISQSEYSFPKVIFAALPFKK